MIQNNIYWFDVAVSIIMAWFFACSPQYLNTGELHLTSSLFLYFILFVACNIIFSIVLRLSANWISKNEKAIFHQSHLFRNSFLIILLCWLPLIIMLYPGTMHFDNWNQVTQFVNFINSGFDTSVFSSHHPVIDSVIIGGIEYTAKTLTGSWQIGFFIFVLIQMLLSACSFAKSIWYSKAFLKMNDLSILILLLFYCFLPIFPLSVQTISKDMIFTWAFVLFTIDWLEICRTRGEVLRKRKTLLWFILLSIFCCLTKKVGLYVIILSLLVLLCANRKKAILIAFLAITVISAVIIPRCEAYMNITPGGSQEKYSMLFQQTARYVKYHGDELTQYEYDTINLAIGMDDLAERYDPVFADPVKGYTQKTDSLGYLTYFKVWMTQGLKHPLTYWEATQAMLSGWFNFTEFKPLLDMGHHPKDFYLDGLFSDEDTIRSGFAAKTSRKISDIYDKLYNLPLIHYLLSYGLYTSILPAFVLSELLKNKKHSYIAAIPMLSSIMLGCWLAPASVNAEGIRYVYPIIYTLPLLMIYCSHLNSESV